MRILITGASGLVGTALTTYLQSRRHTVVSLARTRSKEHPWWDISTGELDWGANPHFDAVIHLAGENIASGRWNAAKKERIRMSRVSGTTLLAQCLSEKEVKPELFICCSAVGFYGDRGDEELTEQSSPGSGFLSQVCQEWEAACAPAIEAGIRTVNMRLGMVLSPNGGALSKMLFPFRLGLGGPAGSGRQFMSWIHIDDLCSAVAHIIDKTSLSGPVNFVAPQSVRNKEFTLILGKLLQRPAVLPAPALALRLILGEMANALLLSSARVLPQKLLDSGFRFSHPDLEGALQHSTNRKRD
ncbi:MAG: TIGR01777 family oxidoreductase [Desulfuromonadaceae bacterium]|nr:TIGR01777 family oxidoreductase [Desulfuromonas sp.]MDY0184533.1 TIGR01777 family oxidoreductase [Desulfuromonadaceae bacterium]